MTRFTWVRIGGICTAKTGSRYVGLAHPQGGSGYVGFGTAKLGLSVWDGTHYWHLRSLQQEKVEFNNLAVVQQTGRALILGLKKCLGCNRFGGMLPSKSAVISGDKMQHYVFIISYKTKRSNAPFGLEIFSDLIEKGIWVVHKGTRYWQLMQPKDKVLFYLAGEQLFLGAATVASCAQAFKLPDDMQWYTKKAPHKLSLSDIVVFNSPVLRQTLSDAIAWKPLQGSSAKISVKDFKHILQEGIAG